MFDIGFSEIILIAVVALVAIGPEDLPGMLFRLGRLTRQLKIFVNNVRNEYGDLVHEAEVEHYRKEFGQQTTAENTGDTALIDTSNKNTTTQKTEVSDV